MPRTQMEKVWVFGGVIVALLLLLIGYTMLISPQHSKTDSAHAQTDTVKSSNQRLEARIAALRDQSKNLAKYQSDLQTAELALPVTSGLPDFLRTLQSIGNATLTTVSSLTVGAPTDVSSVAGGSSARPASATKTSTPSTIGSAVYAMPINAQVTGSSAALDSFLSQLQTVQPRAVLISQLTESTAGAVSGSGATSAGSGTTLQLTMQAFVAPSSAAERARLSQAAGK